MGLGGGVIIRVWGDFIFAVSCSFHLDDVMVVFDKSNQKDNKLGDVI